MPDSEAKKRWAKENMLLIGLKLHRKNDSEIIEYLAGQGENKQKIIKEAIKEYMVNHPEESEIPWEEQI